MAKLPQSFYEHDKVEQLAPLFLNKYLMTQIGKTITGGRIVEVEGYAGRGRDQACHAHLKRTRRNESMFLKGGHAYVYLCYGIHHLFNIVTNQKGIPDAVLVRGLEPVDGLPYMLKRRKRERVSKDISNGPGKLSQALGITTKLDQVSLTARGAKVWIEDRGEDAQNVFVGPRIGIDYAGEDVNLPWRFATDSKYVGFPSQLQPS